MAVLQSLNPAVRNALRVALASALTIAATLWSGRGSTLTYGMLAAVLFVNDRQSQPGRQALQQVAGIVIGVVVALVLYPFSNGWFMLSIALLCAGLVARGLGMAGGIGLANLACWEMLTFCQCDRFDVRLLVNYIVPGLIGMAAALFATWVVWPPQPRMQVRQLDQRLSARLQAQLQGLQRWLETGGEPPLVLHTSEVLPPIQDLQQLARGPLRRWGQLALLWRQVLRQWILLEAQIRSLPPLPGTPLQQQLLDRLQWLAAADHGGVRQDWPLATPEQWLAWSRSSDVAQLQSLAIGLQLEQLRSLLRSQGLLRAALQRQSP
ncbi:MAG: hypothetical protein EBZ51_06560 [Synechococcaceae bacterium WB9_2_112]|nr:hypothetical protein [Synechococcaceae bacterium WB9_2_112]